jgi:hypothetical protein
MTDTELINEIRSILEPFAFMLKSFRTVLHYCDRGDLPRVIAAVNAASRDPLFRSASLRADVNRWVGQVNQRPAAQAEIAARAAA